MTRHTILSGFLSEKSQLAHYIELARMERNVTFVGRLGTYRYLDMDVTIAEAFEVAAHFLTAKRESARMPAFVVDPLR